MLEISRPRRLLLVTAPGSNALSLLRSLTGSAPAQTDTSLAGLTHTWALKTPYYTATIPIWIDEIPSLPSWRSEFSKPEAAEVVRAVGAWVYVFRHPVTAAELEGIKDTMGAVKEVIERGAGEGWDGVCLALGMSASATPALEMEGGKEEWEDVCRERGFEYVDSEEKGKNEFGEPMGLERVREALEANDWADDNGDEEGLLDGEGIGEDEGFEIEEAEMGLEFMGVKDAIRSIGEEGHEDEDEEGQVEDLERMMRRAMAIKDTTAGMPEVERKRFALRAVNDLMKDV